MRLTDDEIRQTVARMRMPDNARAALLKQALSGDPGARFVVYAKMRKQDAADDVFYNCRPRPETA